MAKFPYPISLNDGESINGFLARIGLQYKQKKFTKVLEACGLQRRVRHIRNDGEIEALSECCGIPFDVLRARTPEFISLGSLSYRIHGYALLREVFIDDMDRRVCVECLRENPRHSSLDWDFRFVTTCHKHNVALISICPKCRVSGTLNWTGCDISKCADCGFDLRLASPQPVQDIPEVERFLMRSFARESTAEFEAFHGLRFDAIVIALSTFGQALIGPYGDEIDGEAVCQRYAAAYDMLTTNHGSAIEILLQILRDRPTRIDRTDKYRLAYLTDYMPRKLDKDLPTFFENPILHNIYLTVQTTLGEEQVATLMATLDGRKFLRAHKSILVDPETGINQRNWSIKARKKNLASRDPQSNPDPK